MAASGPGDTTLAPRPEDSGRLAQRIEWLINNMWPTGLEPASSHADVAEIIARTTGEPISHSAIWKLRSGRNRNPTLKTLQTLADFFKIPIGYFADDENAAAIEQQLSVLTMLREGSISSVTLRTLTQLSPDGRRMISEIIDSAARMEQLREHDDGENKGRLRPEQALLESLLPRRHPR